MVNVSCRVDHHIIETPEIAGFSRCSTTGVSELNRTEAFNRIELERDIDYIHTCVGFFPVRQCNCGRVLALCGFLRDLSSLSKRERKRKREHASDTGMDSHVH